jgi:septal ring-binding cell division protein DamX
MFDRLEIFSLASAQARHAAARQAVVAQNIANSDTPGYRAEISATLPTCCARCGTSPPDRPAKRRSARGMPVRRPPPTAIRFHLSLRCCAGSRRSAPIAARSASMVPHSASCAPASGAARCGDRKGGDMTDFSSALGVAASGMRSQAQRLQHVSENIANATHPATAARSQPSRWSAAPTQRKARCGPARYAGPTRPAPHLRPRPPDGR